MFSFIFCINQHNTTWPFDFSFHVRRRRRRRSQIRRRRRRRMIPQQWASPCGNKCTNKYAALTKLPWRVFCKKGCNSDGETWEECLEDCNQLCYKDPVLKDQQWSAYIDRSPGSATYSEECFHACVSGCGYKFEVKPDEADKVCPNRPLKPEPEPAQKQKTKPVQKQKPKHVDPIDPPDIPDTSA